LILLSILLNIYLIVSGSLGFDQLTNNYFTENLIRRELISGKVILQLINSRTSPFHKKLFHQKLILGKLILVISH